MPLMASPHFTPEMQRGPHGTSPTQLPSRRSTSKTNGPGPSVPGIKGRIGPQKVQLSCKVPTECRRHSSWFRLCFRSAHAHTILSFCNKGPENAVARS